MKIFEFKESTQNLSHIAESWAQECNGNEFGLETNVDDHLNDLQKLVDSNSATLFVLSKDAYPIGYMGVRLMQSPLGSQVIANEHYWYVLPEHRGKASLKLLSACDKWAEEKGCSHVLMNASNLASDLHDKVCGIYKSFGMKKFETTYIKALGGKKEV